MGTTPRHQSSDTNHFWISQPEQQANFFSDPDGRFTLVGSSNADARQYVKLDAYSAAAAFVDCKFDVHGDLLAAIRFYSAQPHSMMRQVLYSVLARLEHLRIYSLLGTRNEAAKNIQYHYDRSNEFYAQFLDSRMIYSAAYFDAPDDSLDRAQQQKLEMICRDLVLRPGDTFLDIGCGWGGLVIYAAEHFGARSHGCTLAEQQLAWVKREVERRGLDEKVTAALCDYRDTRGIYNKIASVGMFEHVGKARLAGYFQKIYGLLPPGGLFLNRGVVRPQNVADGPETLFIQRSVFPGGELVHLDDVLREGERAGFEAVGLRDLRTHYALTCKAWVKNLQANSRTCQALVGERTYRTWLLYLAASAVGFEDGRTSAAQVLFMKPRE